MGGGARRSGGRVGPGAGGGVPPELGQPLVELGELLHGQFPLAVGLLQLLGLRPHLLRGLQDVLTTSTEKQMSLDWRLCEAGPSVPALADALSQQHFLPTASRTDCTLCSSSRSCVMLFICLSRVLMCLDESSRSLRASDTSSNCFSISPESDTQKMADLQRPAHPHTRIVPGLRTPHHCILTCDLLLESVDLAPQAPDLYFFVGAERALPRLVLQGLHRLGRLCRGIQGSALLSITLNAPVPLLAVPVQRNL